MRKRTQWKKIPALILAAVLVMTDLSVAPEKTAEVKVYEIEGIAETDEEEISDGIIQAKEATEDDMFGGCPGVDLGGFGRRSIVNVKNPSLNTIYYTVSAN